MSTLLKPRVFLSYARKDGEEFAVNLRLRLEREEPEITLWQDRAELEGGIGWWKQIESALDKVQFLVIVLTPAALRSETTRKEWKYARQRGVNVYPVKGVPDQEIDFSSIPQWMRKAHFFDLGKEWDTFVNYLKSDRETPRVPFMAPDLPAFVVHRPRLHEEALAILLSQKREAAVAPTLVLHGPGGFGKTTLASAICHDDRFITAFDDGILWVTVGPTPNLLIQLTKCFEALTGEQVVFLDVHQASMKMGERLQNLRCLLVIDDVWRKSELEPFLQGGPDCARLITTRKFDIVSGKRSSRLTVAAMRSEEATALLSQVLPDHPQELEPLSRLAHRLGDWPLLIKLAGGTLANSLECGDTLDGAIAFVEGKLDDGGIDAFDEEDEERREASVAVTLEVSLGLLESRQRRSLAQLSIFPEGTPVPLTTVLCLWGVEGIKARDLALRFHNLALLDLDLKRGTVVQHPVIRAYLARELNDRESAHLELLRQWGDLSHLPDGYAWRHIAYHLHCTGRRTELRSLLLDLAWVQRKLDATDINAVIADYRFLPDDSALKVIREALLLSAHVLVRDGRQLCGQLCARLLANRDPDVQALLKTAKPPPGQAWLRPISSCLEAPGGPLLRTLEGQRVPARAVAITPDGRRVVSGSGSMPGDNMLVVWDLERGVVELSLEGHRSWINALVVTPDGQRAISASDDETLRVWDLDVGFEEHVFQGHRNSVNAVAVTPDGRRVISGSSDRTIRIWDVERGIVERVLEGHGASVSGVLVTPDGTHVVSASGDKTLKIWNIESGREEFTFAGHEEWVTAVAITPDGRRLVSSSMDKTLKIWNFESRREERTLSGHRDGVIALAVTPDGRRAVSGSADKTLRIWDIGRGLEERSLVGHSAEVRAIVVTKDGNCVISASGDTTLKVWSLVRAAESSHFSGHAEAVSAVSMTPDGRLAISASRDTTLKLWNPGSGTAESTLAGHVGAVNAVALTPDGRRAISGSWDNTLKVWDAVSGRVQYTLAGHDAAISLVRVTADGRRAVSVCIDKTLRVWNLDRGVEIAGFVGDSTFLDCSISTDGATIIAGDELGRVHFLRLEGDEP